MLVCRRQQKGGKWNRTLASQTQRARPEREVSGRGRVADPRRGMGAQRRAVEMWCILDMEWQPCPKN